jgi:hypothetical protein
MDDPLFTEEPTPKPNGSPPPETSTPEPPAGVSREEFTELRQGLQGLLDNQQSITRTLERLSETASAPRMETPQLTPDDLQTKLLTDPEAAAAAIRELAGNEFESRSGPYQQMLSTLANTVYESSLNEERRQIIDTFGEEAWSKHFDREIKSTFDDIRKAPNGLQTLASPEAVRRVVQMRKGQVLDELIEAREAHGKTREAKTAQEREELMRHVTSNLTGGIRRLPADSDTISPEHKRALLEIAQADGNEVNDASALKSLKAPNTLEEWKKFNASKKEGDS